MFHNKEFNGTVISCVRVYTVVKQEYYFSSCLAERLEARHRRRLCFHVYGKRLDDSLDVHGMLRAACRIGCAQPRWEPRHSFLRGDLCGLLVRQFRLGRFVE